MFFYLLALIDTFANFCLLFFVAHKSKLYSQFNIIIVFLLNLSLFPGADDILNEMVKSRHQAEGSGGINKDNDDEDDGSISLDQIKQSYSMTVERGLDAEGEEANDIDMMGAGEEVCVCLRVFVCKRVCKSVMCLFNL